MQKSVDTVLEHVCRQWVASERLLSAMAKHSECAKQST